jgi:hypothetical protein
MKLRLMEIHGMEFHGKINEIPWNCMEFDEIPWNSVLTGMDLRGLASVWMWKCNVVGENIAVWMFNVHEVRGILTSQCRGCLKASRLHEHARFGFCLNVLGYNLEVGENFSSPAQRLSC